MEDVVEKFLQTVHVVLDSIRERTKLLNYQKPLLSHAFDSLYFFEEECAPSLSEYLGDFFEEAGGRAKALFKKEIDILHKAVKIMMDYSPHKKWIDKSTDSILTVIESIKNLVSDCLDSNPLIKAGLDIFEEAIKFVRK